MDDDLKLPEGDINLDFDSLPDDLTLPKTENTAEADFNLDDFLAEAAPAEAAPLLPQDEIDLDGLLDNDAPLVTEPTINEEDIAMAPEFVAVEEVEPVEDLAEQTASFVVEEDVLAEEDPTATELKGWAFDGLEEEVITEVEPPAEETSNFFEPPMVAEEVLVAKSAYEMAFEPNFVAWYDGRRGDATFELDRSLASTVLQGDDTRKVIHVNVGYDTYGWQVQFAGGVVMGLRDVREYQLRNGTLPDADGIIIYGEARTEFYNIEKITIYENVRYFTYAMK